EAVVVRDGDRPEPDGLRVVEQLRHLDRAVVRPGRVHVEIAGDPGPTGKRVALSPWSLSAGERSVEPVELGSDGGVALAFGSAARLAAEPCAQVVVLGQPCDCGGGELGLRLD